MRKSSIKSLWRFGGLPRRELARRTWARVFKDDVFGKSAQLSYFFIFSLFPLLFFLASLLGYFTQTGSELREELLRYLGSVVPRKASVLIRDTLDEITQASSGGKISFGLLLAVWTGSFGVGAIISTLNAAYGVRESRPWWKEQLVSVGLTIVLALLTISALSLMLYGGDIGELLAVRLGLGDLFTSVWNVVQWPIALAFVLLAFALIYYCAPNVKEISWYWVTPGSVLGLALWLLVSFAFRTYLRFFDTYSTTYGSLGAVMILLLWLYLTGAAILVGGELNAVIEDAAAKAGAPDAKEHGEKKPGDKERKQRKERKERKERKQRDIAAGGDSGNEE
ncbi:MAG TPA: YihY/virulence factor BrkB family protein [Pyrinomonadaceae bacterium]|nr:YihY/virulence factor BrkB family protein [Pyrinomonadaceae bacterium]